MNKHILLFFTLFLISYHISALQAEEAQEKKQTVYETPTVKTLSKLYWALSKFDPITDADIDNYLFINECSQYQDYSQNEFEWKSIREKALELLKNDRKEFSTNFILLQPLRLAEYDIEKEEFDVWQPYKIQGTRRFEILAEDVYEDVCGKPYKYHIPGYPKGLYVEINRPFSLDKIPVKAKYAKAYIADQIRDTQSQGLKIRNKDDVYESREAYIVMKMKIFAHREDFQNRRHIFSKVLAILEGYEIYGDRDRTLLMHSENFNRTTQRSKMEIEMKKRYQERLKKQVELKRKAVDAKEKASTGQ